ncbi:MAG: 1-hydroxy-2-methyl-2-butenyl 4-diphosphate reductase [Myxococcota bacterium]
MTPPETGPELLVLAPLGIEAGALRRGLAAESEISTVVLRTGMGPRRSAQSLRRVRESPARVLVVAGLCGAVSPDLGPGQVLVASELRGPAGCTALASASSLLASLAREGVPARAVPIASVERAVHGRGRERMAREGVAAVDMESAWLHAAAGTRPFAVLRVVADAPGHEWLRLGIALDALRALRALTRSARALQRWACTALQRVPSNLEGSAIHRSTTLVGRGA